MKDRETLDPKTTALIAEYEALQKAREIVLSVTESRVNFFFASISGIAVLLALLAQLLDRNVLVSITFVVAVSLLLLGIVTFVRAVEGHIANLIYVRGMNRIRRYFVTLFPDIKPYFILPIRDDIPRFRSVGFSASRLSSWFTLASIVAVSNSVLAGIITGILVHLYAQQSGMALSGTIGVFAFWVCILLHQSFISYRLKKAEKETEVLFTDDLAT